MNGVEEKIIEIISDVLSPYSRGEVKITEKSHLYNDLYFDELDSVEMTMNLEEEFGIRIDDGIAEEWKTVQDIIDYIKKNKR